MKKATCLNDIISVNADFKNAINLYLNLNDKDKILSYIPTKSSIKMMKLKLIGIERENAKTKEIDDKTMVGKIQKIIEEEVKLSAD